MLDTMDKSAGGLLKHQPIEHLAEFIIQARRVNLITGLAGSLRAEDIPVLATLSPDYLGFRGALCHNHTRADTLDLDAISVIAQTMAGCMGHSKHQPDHHFVSDQSRR
ncbi:MAG TPA: (5-formylfuran-3-yl)methyl phosphate synthase [Thiobacillus sp.]